MQHVGICVYTSINILGRSAGKTSNLVIVYISYVHMLVHGMIRKLLLFLFKADRHNNVKSNMRDYLYIWNRRRGCMLLIGAIFDIGNWATRIEPHWATRIEPHWATHIEPQCVTRIEVTTHCHLNNTTSIKAWLVPIHTAVLFGWIYTNIYIYPF